MKKYGVVLLDTYSGYIEERLDGVFFLTEEEAQNHATMLNEIKNNSKDDKYGKGYEYVAVASQ